MSQLVMYPGQVNSPATELALPIDDIQTTIQVVDASVLPDAPNIATIGVGENAETILYTEKDNVENTLTVTRGFQGGARSWGAGIKIRRLFTAYDWDSIRQNFKTHEAESANKAHGGFKRSMIRLTANQSIANNTNTRISWNAEVTDTSGFWDISDPTNFVIPEGISKIKLSALIVWESNATGYRNAFHTRATGSFPEQGRNSQNAVNGISTEQQLVSAVIDVTAGQKFEVTVRQNSGSALLITTSSWFDLEVIE